MSIGTLVLGFDEKIFKYFAKNYKLHGDSIRKLCEHNSKVALDCNQIQTAQSWLVLKLLFDSEPTVPLQQLQLTDQDGLTNLNNNDAQSSLYSTNNISEDALARENAILGDPGTCATRN